MSDTEPDDDEIPMYPNPKKGDEEDSGGDDASDDN